MYLSGPRAIQERPLDKVSARMKNWPRRKQNLHCANRIGHYFLLSPKSMGWQWQFWHSNVPRTNTSLSLKNQYTIYSHSPSVYVNEPRWFLFWNCWICFRPASASLIYASTFLGSVSFAWSWNSTKMTLSKEPLPSLIAIISFSLFIDGYVFIPYLWALYQGVTLRMSR